VVTGRSGLVHYRTDGEVVFGCAAADGTAALARATEDIYAAVFACLAELDCPHILRIWNYLPEINRELGGIERYRSFNAARQSAFQASRRATRGSVPAACALGSAAGSELVVYFLAARAAATPIENPRQVPAYDYPADYGARSPTFSRAALAGGDGAALLFVSGTASIVGHRTQHPGDVRAQTRETVRNLEALVAQANRAAGRAAFAAHELRYKAYLRNAADLEVVAAEVDAALRPGRPVLYLLADICRSDLLVEIEAVGSSGTPGH
jgi:enamine deaminase RidA (YjgF/YER057c/UK114 family)